MLDHVGVPVSDIQVSRSFYVAALAPLGIGVFMDVPGDGGAIVAVGFGGPNVTEECAQSGHQSFWIGSDGRPSIHTHVCFKAKSRQHVEAFYAAALAAGGRDNGGPGLRPHYHPGYFAAFVIDPDGHNIEAVFHGG